MDLLGFDTKVGFQHIYVVESNKIRSKNPLITSLVQKVPAGFYLFQMLQREDNTTVFELIPKDRSKATLLDLHYIESEELGRAFKLGYATFIGKEEEV